MATALISSHELEIQEMPMTYQLSMVGSDGVVVASDRCEVWGEGPGSLSRTSTRLCKIYLSPDMKFAWTFSGSYISNVAAVYLRDYLHDGQMNLTDDTAEACLRRVGDDAASNFPALNATINGVVVLTSGESGLIFRASISRHTVCQRVDNGKFISGATQNLAGFLPEQFYKRTRRVDELIVLASYAVWAAKELEPSYIDGLDIAVFRNGSFGFVDASPYWQQAEVMNKKLEQLIKRVATR